MAKYRGIIFDNLTERNIATKKCNTEEEARQEAKKSQQRLCKRYACHISRFDITGLEIEE